MKTNERLICVRQMPKSNRELFSKFHVSSSIWHSDIAMKPRPDQFGHSLGEETEVHVV